MDPFSSIQGRESSGTRGPGFLSVSRWHHPTTAEVLRDMVEFRYSLPDEPELGYPDPTEIGIRSLPSRVAVATIEEGGNGR